MKKITLLFPVLLSLQTMAQQDSQFSQYMFNSVYYNPAVTGEEGVTKIMGLYRSQWLGYTATYDEGGPPITQILSVQTLVSKIHGGLGGYIVNERLGPLTNAEAQLSYAYHLKLKNAKLNLGIRTGVYGQTIDFGLFRVNDQADPLLIGKSGKETQLRLDLAAGIHYTKEKYYIGAGINHLNQPTYDFGVSANNQLQRHIYITAGYIYDLSFDFRLHFMTLIKLTKQQTIFDIGGLLYYKENLWGGLSFRQSEAAILILGYSFLQKKILKVGYSLDYVIKDRQAKQATSHEIMLIYSLPINNMGKKVIRTPRFRY